jgi:hypothetical protein
MDVKEGPQNLGVMFSSPSRQKVASSNNQEEYKKLIQCGGRKMHQNISASKLQRHEVLIGYYARLRPAMKYPCAHQLSAFNSVNK